MTALLAFLASALIAGIAGKPLIARLRALALAQHAYEDAPQTHQVKTGTPTMGGLLFLPALLVALAASWDHMTIALCVLTLSCGLIGGIDDLASIRRARNKGVVGKSKIRCDDCGGVTFYRDGDLVALDSDHASEHSDVAHPDCRMVAVESFCRAGKHACSQSHRRARRSCRRHDGAASALLYLDRLVS